MPSEVALFKDKNLFLKHNKIFVLKTEDFCETD